MIEIKTHAAPPPPPPAGKFSPLWLAWGAGGVLALSAVGFAVLFLTRPAKSKPPVIAEAPAEEDVAPISPAEDSNPNPNPVPSPNPTPDPPSVSPNPVPDPVPPKTVPVPGQLTPPPEPPAEPKPAAPKPEKAKPEKPKPASEPAKPATPPKPTNPFDGFAKVIDLPPKTETKEVKLGPAKMPDDYDCVVNLIGGDIAFRRYEFDCVTDAKEGEPPRAWRIEVQGPGASGKRETIAALAIRKDQLMFRWDEKAAENPAAGAFRNCAIQISAGQGAHTVTLRKPLKPMSLPVTYDKQTESWPLPDAPRPDKVMIEFDVSSSSREMPKSQFVGSSTVNADGGEVYISFGHKDADKFLKLQVQTKLDSDSINVTVTPWVQVTGQPKPIALSDANVKKLQETITQTSLGVEGQLAQMPKTKTPARDALQKQLTACRQAENQLAKLKSLEEDFKKLVRLKATKVYLMAGSTMIELIAASK